MRPFIITGTGRCGTKWAATVLRLAGICCGHEQVFRTDDLPSMTPRVWHRFEGDSSLAAVPFLPEWVDHTHRVLLIRHPVDVAASWAHNGAILDGSMPAGLDIYVKDRHPTVFEAANDMDAGLRYWVEWNRQALPHVDTVIRVEDATPELLLEAVGRTAKWPLFPFDEPVNGSDAERPGLDGVPSGVVDEVQDMAEQFGYKL